LGRGGGGVPRLQLQSQSQGGGRWEEILGAFGTEKYKGKTREEIGRGGNVR